MKVKVKQQLALVKYKGHYIRKILNEFNCEEVFIDMPSNEYENAPNMMQPQDYPYASIADAKRFINGQQMTWQPVEADILGAKYWDRFKNK